MTPPKDRRGVIQPRVRAAIDHMVLDGKDLAAAAAAAGLTTARLRKYLTIPHVHKYAWHRRREQLETLCLNTPHELADVIRNSNNSMARVAGIRQAEAIRREDLVEAGEITTPPGLQIVIVQQNGSIEQSIGPPPLQIESNPLDKELAELESPGR